MNPLLFFTDPVLRAPTLGCMWMALAASQVGVVAVVRRRSLLGESLSHATYPGLLVGAVLAGLPFALVGAFCSALLGVWVIHLLTSKLRVHQDAALCFVLSTFFGVGLTLASRIQFTHTLIYRQVLSVLYGQAATMTDSSLWIYITLALLVCSVLALFFKEIRLLCFDRQFAIVQGVPVARLDALLFGLIALSIVIGLRSVGVVLMSSMLVAPPVAARQFSHRFGVVLLLSALFGVLSGYLGNYFSVALSANLSLPTGPMIVLVAALFCLLSLVFAPERGWIWRAVRQLRFQLRVREENLLKAMWHGRAVHEPKVLAKRGWAELVDGRWQLTEEGDVKAARIVRLHRLWEVYLVNCMGAHSDRVHRSAEEMEHILTPELEEELTRLLDDPKQDPHQQPIPER